MASASVSAAKALTPTMAWGCSSCVRGLEVPPVEVEGRHRSSGAKWEAKAKGSPSPAASRAPKSLDPSSQIGTSSPSPGTALAAWPGCAGAKSAAVPARPGERSPLQLPAQRAGRPVGSGSAAQAEVDPARVERLERPELLGDHQRRVVRSMIPPAPTRIVASRRRCARSPRRSPRWRSPGMLCARPPSSACSPPLDVPGQVERVAKRVGRGRPARIGARSRTERGIGVTAATLPVVSGTTGDQTTAGRATYPFLCSLPTEPW